MGYADVEKTGNGYLVNSEDWTEDMGREIAAADGLDNLTQAHWDVINFLRDEYFNNHGALPNDRNIVKAMCEAWGKTVESKDLYDLFPKQPSKQAAKIGGLPESKRKGGY
jgi:tRNA 2-thiouridine synthesizing protein E